MEVASAVETGAVSNCALFDNTFFRELEGFYLPWQAAKVARPRLVALNRQLAAELGLDVNNLSGSAAAEIFSGNVVPAGAQPLVQAYAGHQFGGFSPQLGDGRALLLGEIVDTRGRRRDIALKGSGRTPFSRNGDGKAVLGPVLREYLVSEAMHALGIPTTRALAAVTTGENVHRQTALPGAVLVRVAASHIRIGTFQFFAARGDFAKVQQLADYVIARHYPELSGVEAPYLRLFEAVCHRQAALVARWMLVGFIHGVMNTDNMTISGETLDYGPCAFMEHNDPAACFSAIDQHGRYAYSNQPLILGWNLVRLAETLLPLIDSDEKRATEQLSPILAGINARYEAEWLVGMRIKLGLEGEHAEDADLARRFLGLLTNQKIDYTLAFRSLASAIEGEDDDLHGLFPDPSAFRAWLGRWRERMSGAKITPRARFNAMRTANPLFIPRNHQVEAALAAAVGEDDFGPFNRLLECLAHPFADQPIHASLAVPATPEQADGFRTYCGT